MSKTSKNEVTLDLGDLSLHRFAIYLDRLAAHSGVAYGYEVTHDTLLALAAQVREQAPAPPMPEPVQWCVVEEDADGPYKGWVFVRNNIEPERPWTRIDSFRYANQWKWSNFTRPVILWPHCGGTNW